MASTKYRLSRYKSGGLDIAVESKSGKTSHKDFKQYANTSARIGAWVEMPAGKVVTGLTAKDITFYEEALGIDKQKYPVGLQPTSKYWSENGIFLTQDGRYLDEENDEDRMWIKVLTHRGDTATSSSQARANAKTNYLLTNSDNEAEAKIVRRNYLVEAIQTYASMSVEDCTNYLIMVNQYSRTMSDKLIKDKVGDMVESNPKLFITMYNNPNKKEKVFLQELINNRLVVKSGNSLYSDQSGTAIAYSESQMIEWLANPDNNASVLGYKKQLAAIKKETK